jgi:iron-sulfur cluster repair protein YtfE (RIC family)
MDHRELNTMTEGTAEVVGAANELDAAHATASLWTHLRIHLDKEDTFLYPLLRDGIPEAEQASIVGTLEA